MLKKVIVYMLLVLMIMPLYVFADTSSKGVVISLEQLRAACEDELITEIVIGGDFTITEEIPIKGETKTLDLNGHKIIGNLAEKNTAMFNNDSDLKVKDSIGTGLIDNQSKVDFTSGFNNWGVLTLESGHLMAVNQKVEISTLLDNKGLLVLNGGLLETDNCAIRNNGITVTNNGEICALPGGVAIINELGDIIFNDVQIEKTGTGPAILNVSYLTMNGGYISVVDERCNGILNVGLSASGGGYKADVKVIMNGGEISAEGKGAHAIGYSGDHAAPILHGGTLSSKDAYVIAKYNPLSDNDLEKRGLPGQYVTLEMGMRTDINENTKNLSISEKGIMAYPATLPIMIDGRLAPQPNAYNINGSTYISIRGFADVLEYGDAYYEFDYSFMLRALSIGTDGSQNYLSEEIANVGNCEAYLTKQRILSDLGEIKAEAYNIKGTNYFKLRDLCGGLDIDISWEQDIKTVILGTKYII